VLGTKIEKVSSGSIQCTVKFQEPSGDNAITETETGTITVNVKNLSNKIILPKLNILVKTSWSAKSKSSTKWMNSILPSQTGSYTTSLKWDKKLPSGVITYEVKAIDTNSQIESEAAEVSFNIVGEGEMPDVPVFVNVDINIPIVPTRNKDAIAVIIGNKEYENPDMPNVDYAIEDAKTMRRYLVDMLGYQEENILCVENAKKADFETYFGTKDVYKGKLYNYVKPYQSDVFIYYSGHGAPDIESKKAYFIPANGDPNYIKINGYPLDTFYGNLNEISAKSITVVLDACFSGGSQQGMLTNNVSPMYIDIEKPLISKKINLLTSSSGDQISSWYPEGNHSLFTYFFLRAIRGESDKNRDRKITLSEIQNFINDNVPYMARRKYGREQTPVIRGDLNTVICTY